MPETLLVALNQVYGILRGNLCRQAGSPFAGEARSYNQLLISDQLNLVMRLLISENT